MRELDEKRWEAVPKPKPSELDLDAIQAARSRLYRDNKEEVRKKLDSLFYKPEQKRKLNKEALEQHLTSVFTDGVLRKVAALEKLEVKFQPQKAVTVKRSAKENEETATRLSTITRK